MTQDEIIGGNKIIAKFMGKLTGYGIPLSTYNNYHLNWNIMPVVEKIEYMTNDEGISFSFDMGKDWCGVRHNDFLHQTIVMTSIPNNKELSIWECVVKFLKWYNNLKK